MTPLKFEAFSPAWFVEHRDELLPGWNICFHLLFSWQAVALSVLGPRLSRVALGHTFRLLKGNVMQIPPTNPAELPAKLPQQPPQDQDDLEHDRPSDLSARVGQLCAWLLEHPPSQLGRQLPTRALDFVRFLQRSRFGCRPQGIPHCPIAFSPKSRVPWQPARNARAHCAPGRSSMFGCSSSFAVKNGPLRESGAARRQTWPNPGSILTWPFRCRRWATLAYLPRRL